MKHEDRLRELIGKDHGFRTPEGFLDTARRDLLSRLPERKPAPVVKRSVWQVVRPYVYLAAMFAGIWCTMKMISQLQLSRQSELSLDNPPALVAQAMSAPEVIEVLDIPQQASDAAIVTDAVSEYDNIEEFEKEFDYEFAPEVENIDIEQMQQEFATGSDDADAYDFYDDSYYDYYAYL